MMLVVLEGIIMCFVLLIICVVGIANGPEGMVFFYEKEVQDKVAGNGNSCGQVYYFAWSRFQETV